MRLVPTTFVIPAKAGIHHLLSIFGVREMDSRVRGNDEAMVDGLNPGRPSVTMGLAPSEIYPLSYDPRRLPRAFKAVQDFGHLVRRMFGAQ